MNHVTSIGLDVHARSVTAVALDSITGEVRSQKFGYSPAEIAGWILQLDSPKAVYESGVTGFHLVRELREMGVDCIVGAVSKMHKPASDRRKKNDRNDAELLARQLMAHNIVEVFVPDVETEAPATSLVRSRTSATTSPAPSTASPICSSGGDISGTSLTKMESAEAAGPMRTGSGSGESSFPTLPLESPSTTTSPRCAISNRRRRPSRREWPNAPQGLVGGIALRRSGA